MEDISSHDHPAAAAIFIVDESTAKKKKTKNKRYDIKSKMLVNYWYREIQTAYTTCEFDYNVFWFFHFSYHPIIIFRTHSPRYSALYAFMRFAFSLHLQLIIVVVFFQFHYLHFLLSSCRRVQCAVTTVHRRMERMLHFIAHALKMNKQLTYVS